jgi:hypothetical protein
MRRTIVFSALVAALAVGTGAATAAAHPGSGNRPTDCAARNARGRSVAVVGLVADGTLICFQDDRPHREDAIGVVKGLQQDVSLLGIDYRPANNTLYGLGDAGGVYAIDTSSAAATLVSRLDKPLSGTAFGIDFNPTVDRLRVISDTGQNLRVNVDTGMTTVDSALNLPGATPPVNPALGVVAAAYTNNDGDPATATTLFDIDTTNDQVVVQAPPNNGALNPTGKLGLDAASPTGFDIYTSLRAGTAVANRALASIPSTRGTSLYRIDLLTGRADTAGRFDVTVTDIAIPTDQR